MADNKQFITKEQQNGSVMISEDVIITIVTQAISEVDGVVGTSSKPGSDITEILGKKNWGKGIRVTISEDDDITIDCNIVLAYGQSIVNTGAAVQSAIASAVESMTGVKATVINVNVCGITRQ